MNIGRKTATKSCRNSARETESAEFGVRARLLSFAAGDEALVDESARLGRFVPAHEVNIRPFAKTV